MKSKACNDKARFTVQVGYDRAIRTKIGEALSRTKGNDLSQPLPDQIRTLLHQLDEPSVKEPAGKRTPPR
jgi:hypothetical protein